MARITIQQPQPALFRSLSVGIVLVAAAVLYLRTRPSTGVWQWDFAFYSAASRAWLVGDNPYNPQQLYTHWLELTGGGTSAELSWRQSIMLPTTLPVMAPFALLPAAAAFGCWYLFNMVMLLLMIVALFSLSGLKVREGKALILVAWILLLGPIHSALHQGQPTIAAAASIVVAAWCVTRGRPVAGGLLLGLALCFKIHLAAPFVVYYLYRGHWKMGTIALATCGLITILAVARLQLTGIHWFADWTANMKAASTSGGPNDFVFGNRNRDHLLNLQLAVFTIFRNRAVAEIITGIVTVTGAIVYAFYLRRRKEERDALLLLGPLVALTLLPIYHRYYDATLLAIPLTWAFASRSWRVLPLFVPFLLPVGWATNLLRKGYLPASLAGQRWWDIIVMPEQVWVLLVLGIVVMAALARATFVDTTPMPATFRA